MGKQYKSAPPMTIDPNKKYFATIKMDIGDIRLELYPKDAPQTVNSFVFLARDGYFDGVTFHRVVPGFVAQATYKNWPLGLIFKSRTEPSPLFKGRASAC